MKILIIEPDEYYHHQFREGFSDLGEVLFARHLEHGRKLAMANSPDAIVMELLYPEGSGYDFLTEVPKLLTEKVPLVIIFSRVAHVEDVQESLVRGITGYFHKGLDSISDIKKLLLTI